MFYVVTGSDGFIGKRLARTLEQQGHQVRRLATLTEVCDSYQKRELPQCDGLFHMGAITDTSTRDVWNLIRHNISCTDAIYQICYRQRIPLIYASSAATYGHGPFEDDRHPDSLTPLNDYAWSKNEADIRIKRFALCAVEPPRWYGLKLFNVYGPGEASKKHNASFIHKTIESMRAGNPVLLFKGTGGCFRDWIYVDDAIAVMIWLMQSNAKNGIYNVGTGNVTTFEEIIAECAGLLSGDFKLDEKEMPDWLVKQYQRKTHADIRRLIDAGYHGRCRDVASGIEAMLSETPF